MMRFVVPITKIDEERREVWGYATVDEIDKQGEVVDFDGSKRAFEKWSDGFDKATGGESKGNLREMHRPIAAGKVMAWEADDQARGIIIGAKVIDEGAWVKTRERVYTGFSIGGNPTKMKREKRHGKTVNVIKEYDLVEVSLVDNPASPSSVFTVVKVTAEEEEGAKVAQAFNGLGEALKDAGVVKAVEEEPEVEGAEEQEEQEEPGEPGEQGAAAAEEVDPDKEREVQRGAVAEQAKRISAMLARSARVRKRVQMEGPSISAGVRALESIAFAIESELFEALIGGPGRVVTDDEKRDVAVLTAAAEAVLDFLYSEFQQQLRSVSGEEAMTMTAGVKEAMEKIIEFVKQLATEEGRAAIVKVAKEDETAESMAAMHAMAHGLGAATLKLGAKCSQYGEKCAMMEGPAPPAAQGDQVADTGKAADPVAGDMGKPRGGEPEGGPPGKKPTGGEPEGTSSTGKPTGGEPDSGMNPHGPGRKMDDVAEWRGFAKSLGEIGAQVGSVVQILTDLNSRVKTIEGQPSTVGRPVAPDKTLGAGGVVAGASMAKSWEVLEQLAASETDTSIRDSLLRKAAQERIKAINFPGA